MFGQLGRVSGGVNISIQASDLSTSEFSGNAGLGETEFPDALVKLIGGNKPLAKVALGGRNPTSGLLISQGNS